MSSVKDLKLARFLKVILDILFWALIIAIVGLVIWILVFHLRSSGQDFLGSASVPVILGIGDEPQSEVVFDGKPKDEISNSFLRDAQGTLTLETHSTYLVLVSNMAKIVYGIGLAYLFYLLRKIVQAILDGEPFSLESGHSIRRLGWATLAVGILGPLAEFIAAVEVLNRLPDMTPALSPGPTFDSRTILIALFIFLLAHIWSYGLDLERERSLTI
jgi:hypothetical protein